MARRNATRRAKWTKKKWRDACDKARSFIVRSIGYCEICERTDGQLHDHHLITRGVLYYRYNFNNAMCLCASCHTFDDVCSAHGAPRGFSEAFAAKLPEGSKWWDGHRNRLHYGLKMDWPVILAGLEETVAQVQAGNLALHDLRNEWDSGQVTIDTALRMMGDGE